MALRDYELEIRAWESTLEGLKGVEDEPSIEDINALLRVLRQGLQARRDAEKIEARIKDEARAGYGAWGDLSSESDRLLVDLRNRAVHGLSEASGATYLLDHGVLLEALKRFFRIADKLSPEAAAEKARAFLLAYSMMVDERDVKETETSARSKS